MAINKVRKVRGTDDGCYIYECLLCHGTWESRTSPSDVDGYSTGHVYCGYCGAKWQGAIIWDRDIEYISYWPREYQNLWVIERKIFGKWQVIHQHWDETASRMLDLLKFERQQYPEDPARVRIVSRNSPEFKKMEKGYAGSVGRLYNEDWNYYSDYQNRYGGKLHHGKNCRHWFRKSRELKLAA